MTMCPTETRYKTIEIQSDGVGKDQRNHLISHPPFTDGGTETQNIIPAQVSQLLTPSKFSSRSLIPRLLIYPRTPRRTMEWLKKKYLCT